MDRKRYPANWEEIAFRIKEEVKWTCEGCGRLCRKTGETWPDFFDRLGWGTAIEEKWGRYILTVAHLDHIPENCDRSNLRALCAPCHCRYDLKAMATKRRLKAERAGQMALALEVETRG